MINKGDSQRRLTVTLIAAPEENQNDDQYNVIEDLKA